MHRDGLRYDVCSKQLVGWAPLSLRKHLENHHKLPKSSICRWCSLCPDPVGVNISAHSCLQSGYFNVDPNSHSFDHKCHLCNSSFPTAPRLVNHIRWHAFNPTGNPPNSLRKLKEEKRTLLPAIDSPVAFFDIDNEEITQTGSTDSSSGYNLDNTSESQASVASQAPVPLTRRSTLVRNVPHSGKISHSYEFEAKFVEILTSDPLSDWEHFAALIDEYIVFAKNTAKIIGPGDAQLPSADNSKNPKLIQSLYHRNRRRGIRKVLGETSQSCSIEHAALANHFFTPNNHRTKLFILKQPNIQFH